MNNRTIVIIERGGRGAEEAAEDTKTVWQIAQSLGMVGSFGLVVGGAETDSMVKAAFELLREEYEEDPEDMAARFDVPVEYVGGWIDTILDMVESLS